jgi:hypothetical protein
LVPVKQAIARTKWADVEENESFASDDDENTIMQDESEGEEPTETESLYQEQVDIMLSDLAILTNNYGRMDLAGNGNTDIWKNEPISIYPINDIRESPGPKNIPGNAKSPYDFFKYCCLTKK